MSKENNTYKNNDLKENQQEAPQSENSNKLKDNSFLKKDPIKVILQRLRNNPSKIDRNLLLDLIRETAPITTYKLSKITGFAYTSLKAIVREFEFSGLVKYRVRLGENNRAYKEILIVEEKEK